MQAQSNNSSKTFFTTKNPDKQGITNLSVRFFREAKKIIQAKKIILDNSLPKTLVIVKIGVAARLI